MHVAAGRAGRSVDVAMGIDPDEPDALLLPAVKFRHTAHSSCCNGMIASKNQRNHSSPQTLQNQLGLFPTGRSDLLQLPRFRTAFFLRLGDGAAYAPSILVDKP